MTRLKSIVELAFDFLSREVSSSDFAKASEALLKSRLSGLLKFVGIWLDIKDILSGFQTSTTTVDALCRAKFDESVCTSSACDTFEETLIKVEHVLVAYGKVLTEEKGKDKASFSSNRTTL